MVVKLEPIEVAVVGSARTMMYGVRIKDVPEEILAEMKQHAKTIGGGIISSTVWFEKESARTMFLLRWQ